MNKSEYSYFPLFINLENKNIVVFGAGKIALRRVKSLINTGCNITVVAPNILDEFYEIKYSRLQLIKDIYHKKYLNNQFMVLAITNNEKVNWDIYTHCKQLDIIVNVASDKEKCDFFFPGVIYKEDYTVGICGNGKNHKLVKDVVTKIRNFLDKKEI